MRHPFFGRAPFGLWVLSMTISFGRFAAAEEPMTPEMAANLLQSHLETRPPTFCVVEAGKDDRLFTIGVEEGLWQKRQPNHDSLVVTDEVVLTQEGSKVFKHVTYDRV